jgi:hypothetical protein
MDSSRPADQAIYRRIGFKLESIHGPAIDAASHRGSQRSYIHRQKWRTGSVDDGARRGHLRGVWSVYENFVRPAAGAANTSKKLRLMRRILSSTGNAIPMLGIVLERFSEENLESQLDVTPKSRKSTSERTLVSTARVDRDPNGIETLRVHWWSPPTTLPPWHNSFRAKR